jgi:hypothetical protein
VAFPPEHPQQFRHIAKQYLGPFDQGVAARAKGNQHLERRPAGLPVVDREHRVDPLRLAAATTMPVPGENLLTEAGKMSLVGPLPVIAPLAKSPDIYRGRAAAAEEDALAEFGLTGQPDTLDSTDHFPSLPRKIRGPSVLSAHGSFR